MWNSDSVYDFIDCYVAAILILTILIFVLFYFKHTRDFLKGRNLLNFFVNLLDFVSDPLGLLWFHVKAICSYGFSKQIRLTRLYFYSNICICMFCTNFTDQSIFYVLSQRFCWRSTKNVLFFQKLKEDSVIWSFSISGNILKSYRLFKNSRGL